MVDKICNSRRVCCGKSQFNYRHRGTEKTMLEFSSRIMQALGDGAGAYMTYGTMTYGTYMALAYGTYMTYESYWPKACDGNL